MPMCPASILYSGWWPSATHCWVLSFAANPAPAQRPSPTIEKLIADGWDVAGYASAVGNPNLSLILLKHKEYKYLVQCSVLIDVLRYKGAGDAPEEFVKRIKSN
jgi:hypothetical protein